MPYNFKRLFLFVVSVAFAFLHQKRNFHVFPISILALSIMLLSGASTTQYLGHTILAALYSTTLALWDPPLTCGLVSSPAKSLGTVSSPSSRSLTVELITRLRKVQSVEEYVQRSVAQGTITGCVLMQILRLYDRGWQVQRWPIPVILGSTLGWCIGLILGSVLVTLQAHANSISASSGSSPTVPTSKSPTHRE